MPSSPKIVIVGGVAGGASAAARARRLSEDAHIVLIERGGNISFANCGLPYHIGGAIAERSKLLVQTVEGMKKRFNIDVRTRTEVVRIDRANREVVVRDLAAGVESVEGYDYLILSPGAEPIRPPIPGANLPKVFTLRNLADMDAILTQVAAGLRPAAAAGSETRLQSQFRAVIVGGGYIGLEMAEAFRARKIDVTVAELSAQVFGPLDAEMAQLVHQQLRLHGVELLLGTSVKAIEESGESLAVRLSNGATVACGLVLMAVGVRPEVRLAREAGLTLGPTGGIAVDEHMRTGDERIYAVGDAVEVTDFVTGQAGLAPLAGPASRQGRIAADNVFGRPSVYRKTQGTAICKVFDLAVGITGQSEKSLRRAGRACEKVYLHAASHAGYYPGASPISLKLLFDPSDGRVLGAQAVGAEGVDKRIDVLAVAIRAGMTVYDLEDLELSYAPPYGSAKDPINYAGFVAANALRGDVKLCHVEHMLAPSDDQRLLDVRTPGEVRGGTIPGAINIPVDELRSRLGELPRDKELLVFCQVGLRGYLACRILSQRQFRCRNLTGGYKTYAASGAGVSPAAHPCPNSAERQASASPQGCAQDGLPLSTKGRPKEDGGKRMTLVKEVDATGLQCPGPILRLRKEMEGLAPGQALRIRATDPAFAGDVRGWCHSTGHELVEVGSRNGHTVATVARRAAEPESAVTTAASQAKNKTMVVFSGDFDKAMAAFIIANGAASMGSQVTMFFTFWGLNVLRRPQAVSVSKNLVERMFGWMMPRGADKLGLSKMHMGGMGLAMIKGIMKKKHVATLAELIASARAAGVRLVACRMSMDLMGIRPPELLDGVEEGGVATYLDAAEAGNVNLFI